MYYKSVRKSKVPRLNAGFKYSISENRFLSVLQAVNKKKGLPRSVWTALEYDPHP